MTISTQKRFSQDNKEAFRNPWVIGWIAAIVVVLGVNAAFIVTAIITNPGLVDANYYEKGRDHERNFQSKLEARNRLGWQMKLDIPTEIMAGKNTGYHFSVVDRAGLPITGAVATLIAYRPSDASADLELAMNEITPGIYSVKAALPLKGIWDLTARVQLNGDSLDLVRRVNVAAQ